jgi:hypothetical protein
VSYLSVDLLAFPTHRLLQHAWTNPRMVLTFPADRRFGRSTERQFSASDKTLENVGALLCSATARRFAALVSSPPQSGWMHALAYLRQT